MFSRANPGSNDVQSSANAARSTPTSVFVKHKIRRIDENESRRKSMTSPQFNLKLLERFILTFTS
jgi:hypothetical protein